MTVAFNGSGLFNIDSTGQPVSANTLIESADFNALTADLATGLSNCITKDGQQTVTANLPMATYRHTGVGNAVARTDYAAAGQVQDGKLNWVDGGGTADAITATYSPAITALVDGQLCCVRATAANATTTPTFAPNGLTARTIVKKGGAALVAGDIVADGHELILRYDLTNTRWELLNPGSYASLGANTFTGLQTWKASADIASAATVDLTAATGNTTRITGTTGTSAFTMTAGQWHMCIADGAWPLTYHATTNKLNTGADYTCVAGDRLLLVKDNSNIVQGVVIPAKASQAEMEAGTESGIRFMSPLGVAQAIAALGGGGITLGTAVSASGTAVGFTGIPSDAKMVVVSVNALSTNGTSIMIVQLGDSGGYEPSGYTGTTETSSSRGSFSDGVKLTVTGSATFSLDGFLAWILLDASTNTWVCVGVVSGDNAAAASYSIAGAKSLSATLDRLQITTQGGSNTFDAGTINIAVFT